MFFPLDNIIFPDSCEVIEIVPLQHYVYPIFKNGSSSLRVTQRSTGWQSIYDLNIQQIQAPIEVFVRDPRQRFISGVNTFVQHCLRDNPSLDTDTILHFVKNYLFLNRHYAPQFYWLINLARFSRTALIFKPLNDIDQLVKINSHAGIAPPSQELLSRVDSFPWKQLELYFFLDQILLDNLHRPILFVDLVEQIKNQHPELYDLVFSKFGQIANALSTT